MFKKNTKTINMNNCKSTNQYRTKPELKSIIFIINRLYLPHQCFSKLITVTQLEDCL